MVSSINNFFAKKFPKYLKNVVIVLYEKDTETIKEFENYENNIPKIIQDSLTEIDDDNDSVFYSNFLIEEKRVKMKFKNVEIEAYVGNIVNSQEDVIINPTSLELKFNGNVSAAILKAAGSTLKKELDKPSAKINKDGVLWTNAGELAAKKILHVDVQSSELKEIIVNTLAIIDQERFESVAYPVIGTGVLARNHADAVKNILEGFSLCIDKISKKRQLNLKNIKVCIYERQEEVIFEAFKEEMRQLARKKIFKASPWYAKIYENAKNIFNNFSASSNIGDTNDSDYNSLDKSSSAESFNSHAFKFKLISDNNKKIENAHQQMKELLRQDKTTQILHHDFISLQFFLYFNHRYHFSLFHYSC